MIKEEIKPLKSEYDLNDYYWITADGVIYKITKDKDGKKIVKKMSPFITRDGYVEYVLTLKSGKKKHLQAHRLVALTWIPKPKSKEVLEANHEDGDRQNNHKSNINWKTKKQNIQHSFDKLGKKVHNSPDYKKKVK